MEMVVLALDLDKICRVCLLESESMFSIYSQLFDHLTDEKMPTISNILISISNMKIPENDTLPTMICTRCINSAHIAYKFQQQCNTSQSILESYLEQLKVNTLNSKNTFIVNNLPEHRPETKIDVEHNEKVNSTDGLQYSNNSDTNLILENEDLLAEGLEYIANDYMVTEERNDNDENMMNNEAKDTDETDDCDDLKNCIPLGEDTVDQLIDNFRVENLELISPKLHFNLNLKESGKSLIPPPDPPYKPARIRECPSMDYFKRDENSTIWYDCNRCEESFNTPNDLRAHFKTHDQKKPYLCTDCGKNFKAYVHLVLHARRHNEKRIFECKQCGKKYKQSGTLTAHLRIHTGSKPFLCSVCGRGFRQAPDLTYHMRTHTKEKPYMCNVCGKTMSMQCHLVQHMRSHTGEKPFKCPKCEKAFPSSTRLKRHSIVHTTLKPYKCTVCEKSFNRSSSLKVHNRTHTGVKSYKCNTCNKSFLWAHSLRAHVVTHIKDEKQDEVLEVEDSSLLKFTTMTFYSDEKTPINESFAIFSSEGTESGSKSFQLCAVSNGVQAEGLETFTLYSADETEQVAGPVNSV